MITMLDTIVPKSDQINADDLIGRTLTITITGVEIKEEEQPVTVHFEGDNGKPYRPGKSMRRVMIHVWGEDANKYVGKSMTLYRDDKVLFGGLATSGIRISHMSDIKSPVTMVLTESKKKRKPFVVQPLAAVPSRRDEINAEVPIPKPQPATAAADDDEWLENLRTKLAMCRTADDVHRVSQTKSVSGALVNAPGRVKQEITAMLADAYAEVDKAAATPIENAPENEVEIEGEKYASA